MGDKWEATVIELLHERHKRDFGWFVYGGIGSCPLPPAPKFAGANFDPPPGAGGKPEGRNGMTPVSFRAHR